MKFQTGTKTVETVVKTEVPVFKTPSDAYYGTNAKDSIERLVDKKSLRIVAFRRGIAGEKFIAAPLGTDVLAVHSFDDFGPRFIVEPSSPALPEGWWE